MNLLRRKITPSRVLNNYYNLCVCVISGILKKGIPGIPGDGTQITESQEKTSLFK